MQGSRVTDAVAADAHRNHRDDAAAAAAAAAAAVVVAAAADDEAARLSCRSQREHEPA